MADKSFDRKKKHIFHINNLEPLGGEYVRTPVENKEAKAKLVTPEKPGRPHNIGGK